jgi:lipopolysaccharide/colanic/teichoic acid biosynthesis glycosyltransferase
MSLIGPRPHPIKLNEKFAPQIANIMSRHYVKPGITGLAQCMGYRGETQTLADMENRVRLDRYYIENWSFWLDIKIVFLTVISLIRGSDKAF